MASRAGCSQSSVSKFLYEKAVGRKKCDRKLATTERDDYSLERIVRSNRFNNWIEITSECQDHGVTVSRATIHRRLQEMGYCSRIPVTKPLLNSRQKHRSVTSGQKKGRIGRWLAGKKCSSRIKASFVSNSEIKDLECGDYQERRINQAALNQVSSFTSLSWSGKRWRLVVLDNSVSWSLMLMPKFTSKSLSI